MPHISTYTNGKHCYDMAVLLFQLYPGKPPVDLVEAILYHDAHERTVGDLPAPAKWAWPKMTKEYEEAARQVDDRLRIKKTHLLSGLGLQWLKALDGFEFYLWCLDEQAMGNRNAENCLGQIEAHLDTMTMPEEVREVYDEYKRTGWKRTPEKLS